MLHCSSSESSELGDNDEEQLQSGDGEAEKKEEAEKNADAHQLVGSQLEIRKIINKDGEAHDGAAQQ